MGRLFFHWGPEHGNAAMLHLAGYSFNGPHWDKENHRGSGEVNWPVIHELRRRWAARQSYSQEGPGLNVSPTLNTMKYGNDLLISEVEAHGDADRFVRPMPRGLPRDPGRVNLGVYDNLPLIAGPFRSASDQGGDNYHIYYRAPHDWERYHEGVRVPLRPPQPGDAVRTWDQLAGDHDDAKLRFLEFLSDQVMTLSHTKTRSSCILFDQMFFDVGYGLLEHRYAAKQGHGSRFRSELSWPLVGWLNRSPGSGKTTRLLDGWMRLTKTLSGGDLQAMQSKPEKLIQVLHALPPGDRKQVLEDLASELVRHLATDKTKPVAIDIIRRLVPLLQTPEAKVALETIKSAAATILYGGEVDFKRDHPEFFRAIDAPGIHERSEQMVLETASTHKQLGRYAFDKMIDQLGLKTPAERGAFFGRLAIRCRSPRRRISATFSKNSPAFFSSPPALRRLLRTDRSTLPRWCANRRR